MKQTFEDRLMKLIGAPMWEKSFQDSIKKEIEEHLLDDGVSARAIAEIIVALFAKTVWNHARR